MDYRQGDVGITKAALPEGAVRKTVKGPIVLAYGETTGHKHQIADTDNVELYEKDGVVYVRVIQSPAELRHEEHGTVALTPDTYRVTLQQEYAPEAIRNVAD